MSTLPRAQAELDTSNPVSQAITTSRAKFPKDVDHYAVLATFGSNVVVSEGEEWKKYRKIVAPAFSEVRPELRSSPDPEDDC
jgi:cytochrome P450